ncbi:hypothetical protein QQF64_015363 [Cirrhinus molitorella]|uniref:Uncharacterized protein n=1 Tax=Cirrhinus molitorella TaxID=172907 RepID=A0ABR3NVQ0_9TELE
MLVLAFEKETLIEWQGRIATKCESNHRLTHHAGGASADELSKQPTISSDKQKTETRSMRDGGTCSGEAAILRAQSPLQTTRKREKLKPKADR